MLIPVRILNNHFDLRVDRLGGADHQVFRHVFHQVEPKLRPAFVAFGLDAGLAFAVGKDRSNVDNVILAGWEINECINKRWKYDETKWCVPVKDLRPMEDLNEYIR